MKTEIPIVYFKTANVAGRRIFHREAKTRRSRHSPAARFPLFVPPVPRLRPVKRYSLALGEHHGRQTARPVADSDLDQILCSRYRLLPSGSFSPTMRAPHDWSSGRPSNPTPAAFSAS